MEFSAVGKSSAVSWCGPITTSNKIANKEWYYFLQHPESTAFSFKLRYPL